MLKLMRIIKLIQTRTSSKGSKNNLDMLFPTMLICLPLIFWKFAIICWIAWKHQGLNWRKCPFIFWKKRSWKVVWKKWTSSFLFRFFWRCWTVSKVTEFQKFYWNGCWNIATDFWRNTSSILTNTSTFTNLYSNILLWLAKTWDLIGESWLFSFIIIQKSFQIIKHEKSNCTIVEWKVCCHWWNSFTGYFLFTIQIHQEVVWNGIIWDSVDEMGDWFLNLSSSIQKLEDFVVQIEEIVQLFENQLSIRDSSECVFHGEQQQKWLPVHARWHCFFDHMFDSRCNDFMVGVVLISFVHISFSVMMNY